MGDIAALPQLNGGYDGVMEWRPARLITEQHTGNDFSLLVLNQPLNNLDLLKVVWRKAKYRIAADGGGNRLYKAYRSDSSLAALMNEIPLETIHGDLDSLTLSARQWATTLGTQIAVNHSQESTDFEKCIDYITANYLPNHSFSSLSSTTTTHNVAPDILVLGGLGGRVDQSLSVLHHLYKGPRLYPAGRIYLLTTSAITFLLPKGTHRIVVRDEVDAHKRLGKHIGILPLAGTVKISTEGLEWDVEDWETVVGGQLSTSNHVKEDVCMVKTSGDVLFTIDMKEDE